MRNTLNNLNIIYILAHLIITSLSLSSLKSQKYFDIEKITIMLNHISIKQDDKNIIEKTYYILSEHMREKYLT